jgi:hypothetical protein
MEKGAVKLVIFNDEYFGYQKNQTRNYLNVITTGGVRDPRDARQRYAM